MAYFHRWRLAITVKIFLLIWFAGVCIAFGQAVPIANDQFHLYGPNSGWGEYLRVGGNGWQQGFASVSATNGNLHLDAKNGFAMYLNHYSGGNTFINPQAGLVGIGTSSPIEKLDIVGNSRMDRIRLGNAVFKANSRSSFNSFNSGADLSLNSGWIAADFGGADNGTDRFVVGTGFNGRVVLGSHRYDLNAWGGDILISPFGGNVGIGVTSAQDRLAVNGVVRAKEVRVTNDGWADYVFSKDYKLKSLDEVESFIKFHGHLPSMPSAKEVAKEGLALGDMERRLLEKIEELTLHLIEKDKQIQVLEKECSAVKDLRNRLVILEALVNKK